VLPTLDFRTGDVNRGLGTGGTRKFLPVWVQKDIGDWTINTGGGYALLSGVGNKNYWFTGVLLQRKISDQLKIGAEMFHQTADKVDGKDQTGFNVGGIYDFTDHYHLVFTVGRGIQHAKETNDFSWYIGFYVTGPSREESLSRSDVSAGNEKPSEAKASSDKSKVPQNKKASHDEVGKARENGRPREEATSSKENKSDRKGEKFAYDEQVSAGSDAGPGAVAWTGFYLGADLGHVWHRVNEADWVGYPGPFLSSYSLKGPIGGSFAGFNWRSGPILVGLEVDAEAAGVTGAEWRSLVGLAQRQDVRGSARGRIGVAGPRALFYGTGGFALANFFPFALGEPFSQARPGWTVGAGLECAISKNWSGRIEYRRSDFGSTSYVSHRTRLSFRPS
jgi:opacity protein-like surface antigen